MCPTTGGSLVDTSRQGNKPGAPPATARRALRLFSHSASSSLRPYGLQHTRPPCPPLSPGVYSSSCPSSCDASNHLILCCPLLLPPSVFPSIRVFSKESALPIRKPCSLLPQTPVQSVLKMVLASFHELVSFSGLLPFPQGFLVNFQDSFDQALHKVLQLQL